MWDQAELSRMLRAMARRLTEERRELRQDVQDHIAMLNAEDLVFERALRFKTERESLRLKLALTALLDAVNDEHAGDMTELWRHAQTVLEETDPGQLSKFVRLSVNINDECAQALREVKAKRGFSTTEAIRRAIGLLDYFEMSRPAAADEPTKQTCGCWLDDPDCECEASA
jgi:hypothetical protein